MKKEQNAGDVRLDKRLIMIGGLAPIVFTVLFGPATGLALCMVTYWLLAMRVTMREACSGAVDTEACIERRDLM